MGSKPFQFKQFSVEDGGSTHKVGTDGVLLGSWVEVYGQDNSLLDIGTGCGLIAIMLAQRTHAGARIDAVEIQEDDAEQAIENVVSCPWPEKIRVWRTAIQDYAPARVYDLIVSNPPFFINSLSPPDQKRGQARHTHTLSFDDLLIAVNRLISPDGRFATILPYGEANDFINVASGYELFPARLTTFRSRSHKPVERLLMEFVHSTSTCEQTELVLYEHGEVWSEAYRSLTKDFYLRA